MLKNTVRAATNSRADIQCHGKRLPASCGWDPGLIGEGAVNGGEVAKILCWWNLLEILPLMCWTLEFTVKLHEGVFGEATCGEILAGGLLLQSCSAECWSGLLGAREAASCRTQDAREAGTMGTHWNRKDKNPFLFQCTSSCLYRQGLTPCQLQQSNTERAQLYFGRGSSKG